MKLSKILVNNIGIKFLALVLALVTWIYASEATKMDADKTILQKLLSPSNYVTKKLVVKPILVGRVPDGYKIFKERVKAEPSEIVIAGPAKDLEKREVVYTKSIDLSEYTKAKSVEVGLKSLSRLINFQKATVQVFLPIQKIPTEKTE